jgi:hypothetical protein
MPETPTKRDLYDALADRVRHLMQYTEVADDRRKAAAIQRRRDPLATPSEQNANGEEADDA